MNIEIETKAPERTAQWFRVMLAVDKGVASTIQPCQNGFVVTADDGKKITFKETV